MTEAPKKIYVRITDKTVMLDRPSDVDDSDVKYIRADIVEGLVRGINAVLGAKEFDGMTFSDRLSLAKSACDSFLKP